jgi:hypothetical protein
MVLALILILACFALFIWWYITTARVEYCVDVTRQRLFTLRDRLFDKARKGEISFESDAYGIFRMTINGQIRFCEDLTFVRVLIILGSHFVSINRDAIESYTSRLDKALGKITDSERKIFEDARSEMHFIILIHIIESSLILKSFLKVFVLLHGLHSSIRNSVAPLYKSKRMIYIDAEAALSDATAIA